MKIHELHYSNTNTYVIEGDRKKILFDTGWAGTFPAFCGSMRALDIPVQALDYILISHFHPDHMGIAQEIADLGPVIVVMDGQKEFVHAADHVFGKEKNSGFRPIREERVKYLQVPDSRRFLEEAGINGEILYTPGHSDDSISLCLDDGTFFVGDLNPLYELELHKGTQIEKSWDRLLAKGPKKVYYGHAKPADLQDGTGNSVKASGRKNGDFRQVSRIIGCIDKGMSIDKIQKKTGADTEFITVVAQMHLTHPDTGIQGIIDRIELNEKLSWN